MIFVKNKLVYHFKFGHGNSGYVDEKELMKTIFFKHKTMMQVKMVS